MSTLLLLDSELSVKIEHFLLFCLVFKGILAIITLLYVSLIRILKKIYLSRSLEKHDDGRTDTEAIFFSQYNATMQRYIRLRFKPGKQWKQMHCNDSQVQLAK